MKTNLFVFALLGIIIFMQTGCETESHDVAPKDLLVINASGDYTFIESIDTIVYASLWGSVLTDYKIDLNSDSKDDIEFSCSVYHHTVYDEWNASVKTLNDEVAIDVAKDTASIASYSIDFITPSGNDTIEMFYNENYDPAKQYPANLLIENRIYDFPVVHSTGDSLNQFCNWKSGSFILEFDDHQQGQIKNNIQIGNWRNINNKFIGVRFVENSVSYYGWIELGVENYYITLHKYATKVK